MKWYFYSIVFLMPLAYAMNMPQLPAAQSSGSIAAGSSGNLRKESGTLTHLKTPREERPLRDLLRALGFALDGNGTLASQTPCQELDETAKQHLDGLRILTGEKPEAPYQEALIRLCKLLLKGAQSFADLAQDTGDDLNKMKAQLRAQKRIYRGPIAYDQAQPLLTGLSAPSGSITEELSNYQKILDAARLLDKAVHYRYEGAQGTLKKAVQLKKTWEDFFVQHPDCKELRDLIQDAEKAKQQATECTDTQEKIATLERAAAQFLHAYHLSKNHSHLESVGSILAEAKKTLRAIGSATPETLQRIRHQYHYIRDHLDHRPQSTTQQPDRSLTIPGRSHATRAAQRTQTSPSLDLLQSQFTQALMQLGFIMPPEILQPCKPNEPNHGSQQHYFEYWYHTLSSVAGQLLGIPQIGSLMPHNDAAFATMAHLSNLASAVIASARSLSCDNHHQLQKELSQLHVIMRSQEQALYGSYYYQRGLSAWILAEGLAHAESMGDIMNRVSALIMAHYRLQCAADHGHEGAKELSTFVHDELMKIRKYPPQQLRNFAITFDVLSNRLATTRTEAQKILTLKKSENNLDDICLTQDDLILLIPEFIRLFNQYPSKGLLEMINEALILRDQLEVRRGTLEPHVPFMMNDQWQQHRACKEQLANQSALED